MSTVRRVSGEDMTREADLPAMQQVLGRIGYLILQSHDLVPDGTVVTVQGVPMKLTLATAAEVKLHDETHSLVSDMPTDKGTYQYKAVTD